MPPKIKITKEDILKITFQMTKEKGFDSINARSIADALGCSTQPIFRIYANMADLKQDLYEYINIYFENYLTSYKKDTKPFLTMGLAYIDFAKNERNLFRLLCLSDNLNMTSFAQLVSPSDHSFVMKDIPNDNKINEKKMQDLFMNIWLYTHGIATMLSTNQIDIPEDEIKKLLTNAFKAFSTL